MMSPLQISSGIQVACCQCEGCEAVQLSTRVKEIESILFTLDIHVIMKTPPTSSGIAQLMLKRHKVVDGMTTSRRPTSLMLHMVHVL